MSVEGYEHGDVGWPYGPVVFGCGNFGGIGGARDFVGKGMGEEASLASMDEAVDLGLALFDTAERYADGERFCTPTPPTITHNDLPAMTRSGSRPHSMPWRP